MCHVVGLLDGSAHTFMEKGIDLIHNYPTDPSRWLWKTPIELWDRLDSRYLNAGMVTDAKIKLQKLSMTGSYSRYPEFLSEFYTLAEAAEVSAEFRVHLLRSKVTQSLRDGTRGNLSPPAADDFEGWANVYSTIWSNMETEKQINSQNQSHNQPVRP
ncbi:hypothetical protein K3495_g16273 [Podosphaera aphanis]|nr:hypothetical protein K3495_g16273 [Podosphaera aphanis]